SSSLAFLFESANSPAAPPLVLPAANAQNRAQGGLGSHPETIVLLDGDGPMRLRWRTILIGMAALGLPCTLRTAEPAEEGYAPVSPPPAVHAALQSSLKAVQDWLGGKDFASAAQEAQGLTALAHLYAYQGSDPGWRDQTRALADVCSRLTAAAGKQ